MKNRKADWGMKILQFSRKIILNYFTSGRLLVIVSTVERGPGPIPTTVTVPDGISVCPASFTM